MDFTAHVAKTTATSLCSHAQSVKLHRKDLGGVVAQLLMSTRRRHCQFCHENCFRGVHKLSPSCHFGKQERTLAHARVGCYPVVWPRNDRYGDVAFLIYFHGLETGQDVLLIC